MTSTLRLEDCGDFLTLIEYAAWRGDSERAIRRRIKLGTELVMPCEERPRIRFRRSDCEAAMKRLDVVRARQVRAKAQAA